MNGETVIEKIVFSIPGEPQGKARPRVTRNKFTGKSVTYTPDKTVAYEELIRARYSGEAKGFMFSGDAALEVKICALFSIPKRTSAAKECQMRLGKILPTKKPDCDNIAKIVCDALNGIAYRDDSQIAEISVRKRYSNRPGTFVSITKI